MRCSNNICVVQIIYALKKNDATYTSISAAVHDHNIFKKYHKL